jgi:hypothetical protein
MFTGNPITFEAKPAFKPIATSGAIYRLSVVEESRTIFRIFFLCCFYNQI